MPPHLFDAIVIGGGPAGSTAARMLALRGHRVLLLARSLDPLHGIGESIPPSTRKLFSAIGLLDRVERAGFQPTTGNTVWWGADAPRVEMFGEEAGVGFQVLRPELDRLLVEGARDAGARMLLGAAVRRVSLDGHDSVRVEYEHGWRPETARSRIVLDCSGRTGILARRYRRYQPNGRMQALIGSWACDEGWDVPDATHTLVETYEDGWAWSVPVSAATRHIAVMVDGTTTCMARGSQIEHVYRNEIAKTRRLGALAADSALRRVWACDASLYDSTRYGGSRFLLVGDAAAAIDPLSSFGVKKALASAWMAAVVAHTILIDPSRRRAALDLYARRERQVYASHLVRTREFARDAHQRHPHPFWAARAAIEAAEALPADEPPLARRAEVASALDALRHSAGIALGWSDRVRFAARPIIRGWEVVLDRAVSLPGVSAPVRFLDGIDLVELGDLAGHHSQVPDLYEAYCRSVAPASLPNFLAGLSVLVAHGALEPLSREIDASVASTTRV